MAIRLKSLTFSVAKGGVGKTVLMANVAVALARRNHKVIVVEGDPTQPLDILYGKPQGSDSKKPGPTLKNILEEDSDIKAALKKTAIPNLYLISTGVKLEDFFEMHPFRFADKLTQLDCDFLFVDAPYPSGEAAMLTLGTCQYFVPIITEDDFAPSLNGAIDTIDIGLEYLHCVPVGYIFNRIKNIDKLTKEFVDSISSILELQCIALIKEDENVTKSYGRLKPSAAIVAYDRFPNSEFAKNIRRVAEFLEGSLPLPKKLTKSDVLSLLQEKIEVIT